MLDSTEHLCSLSRRYTVRIGNVPEDYILSDLTKFFLSFCHVKDVRLVDCYGVRHGLIDLETNDIRYVLKVIQMHGWEVSLTGEPYEDKPLIWSGFFSRNKSRKVGVDVYLLQGDFRINHRQYHIDIPYRIPIPNKDMFTVNALLILQAENCTHQKQFNEYVKYFCSKERAGYASVSPSHDLILMPYCAKALELAPLLQRNQILGLVVDKKH